MGTFDYQFNGKTYQIEAKDQNELDNSIKFIQSKASAPAQPDTLTDVAASGGSGIARGAADLLGLPGTISNLMNKGLSYVTGLPELPESVVSGDAMRGYASKATDGATDYEPKTTAGEYARTAGEFLSGAIAFGGMSPAALGRNAVLPAVASETAGQATEGSAYEPYARIAGALAGAAAPSVARRAVTPLPVSPERQAMVDVLRREGVDLTAGQSSGRKSLQAMESELGAGAPFMERQGEQFTAAALRRAGIDANRATPDVIDDAFTRIGQQFDDLSARNNVAIDQQAGQEIGDVFRAYTENVAPTLRSPIVENIVTDISVKASQGPLTGEFYKTTASKLAAKARETKDPELKNALLDIRGALDDAMERSIAATNPGDLGAFQEARTQYRNLLGITQAATGAGENAALGIISPQALRQSVVGQGRSAYARGQGDFADLARAGEATMRPLPNSGTATRLAARGGGGAMGAMIGALLSGGSPLGAAAGAMASPVLNAGVGRALMSGPVRAYLGNQLAAQTPSSRAKIEALARALLQSGAASAP